MGLQSKERQDELFDLRLEKRQLLYALTLAICGGPREQAAAKEKLSDFASDPAMAKYVLASFEGSPESFVDYEEIKMKAMATMAPPRRIGVGSARLN